MTDGSNEFLGAAAAVGGGGMGVGYLLKYCIDKLAERRNGSSNGNGKVALTELKINQQQCMRNQDETLHELKEIKEYSHEQAIYLKIMCERASRDK